MLKLSLTAFLMALLVACSAYHSDEYAISVSERTLEKASFIIENEIKPNTHLTDIPQLI